MMLAQYIMAISMWCGQPQVSQQDRHNGYYLRHSINSYVLKIDCQRKLLACLGPYPSKSSNPRIHSCFMGFQEKQKQAMIQDSLNDSFSKLEIR